MSKKNHMRPALGQRQTRQRDRIFEVIREAQGPLTVPEIFERAQQAVPGLGIATVYRTINLLQDVGQIESVILPSGETRYEMSDLGHHHHFQCRKCEEVYDLDDCPVSVSHGRATPDGFVIESHELTLYGVCPTCAKAA
jgi:Fur family transcriptional regulator, ferric uptake regulator